MQMQRDLQEVQTEHIQAGHVMDQSKPGSSYDELVQYTLTDGIHWKHAVASSIHHHWGPHCLNNTMYY